MVAVTEDLLQPPSRWVTAKEWDTLEVPEHYRAEIIRGELVLSPGANRSHQNCVTGLILVLAAALPDGYQVVTDLEWRLDHDAYVARAPRPDLVVATKSREPLTDAPLLAIEILSPSDSRRLEAINLSRIEGKVLDYSEGGLRYYMEISLTAPFVRLHDLVSHRVVSDAVDVFSTDIPFPFRFQLSDLL